jgi:maltose alpha-D-glucosyltransferase/alpha-amylase
LSLLLSLPGTPILLYGDEIGLGDDLTLPGRTAVRVPMQWTDGGGGGFSTAPPDQLIRPPHHDGRYGYTQVNVTGQDTDPHSQLAFVKRAISVRRRCPEIGHGRLTLLDAGHLAALAVRYDWQDGAVVIMNNLGGHSIEARLNISGDGDEPIRVLLTEPPALPRTDSRDGAVTGKLADPIPLAGHGICWLRLVRHPAQTGSW